MFAAKSALLHMKICRFLINSFQLEGGISVSGQFTCVSFSRVVNCNGKKFKHGHAGLGGLLFFLPKGQLYF